MSQSYAEQPALDGLAPRRHRKHAPAGRVPASELPIAQVVLDVQATHLGQTFDYLVDARQSDGALPGAMVRVRFGSQRVNGIVWKRAERSNVSASSLRYLERVLGPEPLVGDEMRRDIALIADAYGGTRANIIRVAVPARVARVDKERQTVVDYGERSANRSAAAVSRQTLEAGTEQLRREYDEATRLLNAIAQRGFASFVMDVLPGPGLWARDLATMAAAALDAGKAAVLALPGMRETQDVAGALRRMGLKAFDAGRPVQGEYRGDFIVLSAALPPTERYRAYAAAASGGIRCVIGTRAAMYAPVEGPALFAIVEDAAYQNADGMMPYANARGVMRLRAEAHHGVFVAMANARSALSQWEVSRSGGMRSGADGHGDGEYGIAGHGSVENSLGGASRAVHPLPGVIKDTAPWVRWLNREELARLADPTVGSRVPHIAVRALNEALGRGPVLLSIPHEGIGEALSCSRCRRQSRCPRCTGPLMRGSDGTPRCRWCGAAAVNWRCPHCDAERMRVVRVGAAGTAAELQGLFRGVPMVISSPSQPGGVIEWIPCRPILAIATPGAEPRVRPAGAPESSGDTDHAAAGKYSAVAILDAWTSLYAPGVDARVDALNAWMKAISLCAPRSRGGQAFLIGESDPVLARSLVLWDSSLLAAREIEERQQTGLPPALSCACVWGRRDAVMGLLRHLGMTPDGAHAMVGGATGVESLELPAVLGPVPIAAPKTMDAREFEATRDRVKAVLRVSPVRRDWLARGLRDEIARHVAAREPGELRFQLDPKDLL
ncbi:primosomal protein N' [Bifidobacterium sp.]|jgi:primosomal protein N' (replication factor Y)|uniref:primosomal protein N' family DNA-binding protein n=1 Tax=Bifidobacterium sp. TaxID=41200 RepID=UPI0025C404A7|nr:primosomal protein N' [Bifidobacterium sp.]MCH4208686.1 primosomal protein N' [Bifidobacterium sp.]MCI1224342.1 primosomal protein N' [Bifidobacterium sp.]